MAPPPVEGAIDQGSVIRQCLASQARARRHENKGATEFAAAAARACVCLHLVSLRPARRCRTSPEHSLSNSPMVRPCRSLPVRHSGICLFVCCLLLASCLQGGFTGRPISVQVQTWEPCQTGVPCHVASGMPQRFCKTALPCPCTVLSVNSLRSARPASLLLCPLQGTRWLHRPRARLRGTLSHKLNRSWAYRGCRLGEASNPKPNEEEPVRYVTIHRVAMEPPRPCTIRMAPQGGVWIWIVHSHPPLRVAGRKTPAC